MKTEKVLEFGTSRVGLLTKIGTVDLLWTQTPVSSRLRIRPCPILSRVLRMASEGLEASENIESRLMVSVLDLETLELEMIWTLELETGR